MRQKVYFEDLGLKSYQPTWDYQEKLLAHNTNIKSIARANEEDVRQTTTEHRLLFVEHPPVFTLGKNGKREHVLVSEEHLQKLGIEFFHINRGGDITYHGPQQIVGYPILDLDKFKTDLGWYLRNLEQVIIDTIAEYGLVGERSSQMILLWLEKFVQWALSAAVG
jgi:lipoyl(octanoyl) transferase